MKKGNHLKTLLYTLIAVLLLTAAMNPITRPVDEVLQGVELSLSDPTQTKPVTLSLTGDYGWKIFGEDALHFTLEAAVFPPGGLRLYTGTASLKTGSIAIPSRENDLPLRYPLYGDLCFTPFETRKELVLLVDNTDGDLAQANVQRCFVFPADDRESALALLATYDKESHARFTAAD